MPVENFWRDVYRGMNISNVKGNIKSIVMSIVKENVKIINMNYYESN